MNAPRIKEIKRKIFLLSLRSCLTANVAFVYLETESRTHKMFLQRIFMFPCLIKCATQFHRPKEQQEPLTCTKLPQTEFRFLKLGKTIKKPADEPQIIYSPFQNRRLRLITR